VTRDLKYAFVVGYNQFVQGVASRDPDISLTNPAGGNIGIIKDPFGAGAKLVAATRMTPYSFPDNLALSASEEYLYAAYSGDNQVQVFGVNAMIADVERILHQQGGEDLLARKPINEFIDSYDATGHIVAGLPLIPNPLIDVKADFRLRNAFGVREFGNFIDTTRAPLSPGASPRGIAVQDDFLKLLTPKSKESTDDQTPTLTWTLSGREATVRVFVSAFGPGQGLFPEDPPPNAGQTNSDKSFGPDANRNRIFTSDEIHIASGAGNQTLDLPADRTLTRGQTYWWGVEATTPDGRVHRKAVQFKASPVTVDTSAGQTADHFAAVTLITHGWQLPYISSGCATADVKDVVQLGQMIADQGGGKLFIYNPQTGEWRSRDGLEALTAGTAPLGKPLVLISDWTTEAPASDSGFAEAAADAIFASLADRLGTADLGDALKKSPWHLIGFSRGASVTSEIVQRLGTYYPTGEPGGIAQLQVTMLDPHDFAQASLAVPLQDTLSKA